MESNSNIKVAAITDDGTTISYHFGRARLYMVVTIEDGKIVHSELREKLGHNNFSNLKHEHGEHDHHGSGDHGSGDHAHHKHQQMAEAIQDCEAVLCRGMGHGAYEGLQALGIQPVVTNIEKIDEAALAYASGEIVDHTEKLH